MALPSQFSQLLFVGLDMMKSAIAASGAIIVQLGNNDTAFIDSDRAEWWQHTGFASRPAKPTPPPAFRDPNDPQPGKPTAACQAIGYRRNDHDIVLATKDARHSSIWDDLDDDEAQIYSFGGSCRVVCRSSGKVQIPATEIDLGSLSPGDALALASKVLSELQAIQAALSTAAAPSGGGPVTYGTPYVPNAVASALVKVSG